jgi:hypothetical protein
VARVPTFNQIATTTAQTVSTVPTNFDLNPYGVAFEPKGFAGGGVLQTGDVLVSNFNNSQNFQGTGTTIVQVTPGGQQSVFYKGPPGLSLSTALGILEKGFVVVGYVTSTDRTSATAQAGGVLLLNSSGTMVANITNPSLLNGPWDMAIADSGRTAKIFVSDVLSGPVSRFDVIISPNGLKMTRSVQIA